MSQSRVKSRIAASDGTILSFADYGAGPETKLYHRLVVLFVVVMLVGVVLVINIFHTHSGLVSFQSATASLAKVLHS